MRSLAACLLALLLAGGTARAETPGERDVIVANHAPQTINEIYISPASADHWGEDRLGEATLPPGHSLHIELGPTRDCAFDVQVVYEDASRETARAVDVCREHELSFDGSHATAPAQAPAHLVTIANRSARPIQQVLISPSDAADWGEDRLGNGSISVGEAATVKYRGDCVADIRVVFDNQSAEERRHVDVCTARRIAIRPGWTTADVVPTEAQPGVVTVQLAVSNHTGRRVMELYLFPEGSPGPGPELLSEAGLADGAGVAVAFARPAGTCRFTARVAFGAGQAAETVGRLDLCRSLDLALPAPP